MQNLADCSVTFTQKVKLNVPSRISLEADQIGFQNTTVYEQDYDIRLSTVHIPGFA